MEKIKVIVVAGPTASGKTALGVEIAKAYNGEVVSADSMQIYKGMDIATAKPTAEEMCGVPHHLIDFLERDKAFSVADYVELAGEKIRDISSRGKIPVIVGGTGLYISSLIDNIQFPDIKSDPQIRNRIEEQMAEKGCEEVFEQLKQCDPETAAELHPNNTVRVIRALEVFEITGRKLSSFKEESRLVPSPYDALIFGLNFNDRQKLYDRINQRVDIMIENGLVNEAREVYEAGEMKTAANAIGFKELIPYFENAAGLDECTEKIKQETRRYAKRQLTWFRKNAKIQWIMLDEFDNKDKILDYCKKNIAKRLSL
ncbi:MAG: tRNA (adenosine(37)-N6)-dimethylallyltransferase MiaA [Oscillospiraceae bacterium]|nr:tRNA (adenosine(37)-N6)-dimethylallyltransferase MiaA [Oscillospiraceae bacterium]